MDSREYTNFIFNICETPINNYICEFFKVSPEKIFINPGDGSIHGCSLCIDGKKVSLSLEIKPFDYRSSVPDHPSVQYYIDVFKNGFEPVFNTVMGRNIKEEFQKTIVEKSLGFKFDEDRKVFYPIYVYHGKRLKQTGLYTKELIEKALAEAEKQNNEKDIELLKEKYDDLQKMLSTITFDAEEIDKLEKEKNEELKNNNVIGIIFNYL